MRRFVRKSSDWGCGLVVDAAIPQATRGGPEGANRQQNGMARERLPRGGAGAQHNDLLRSWVPLMLRQGGAKYPFPGSGVQTVYSNVLCIAHPAAPTSIQFTQHSCSDAW